MLNIPENRPNITGKYAEKLREEINKKEMEIKEKEKKPDNLFPLNITDDMTDEEKYVREQAMQYVDETAFLSYILPDNPHINNIVNMGKSVTPYIISLLQDNLENDGIYMHFCLLVLQIFYKDDIKIKGYIPMKQLAKLFIKMFNNNLLKY